MDNATVIKLLEQQKDDIKDLISGQAIVISARVDAKFDQKFAPLDAKVDSIVAHNERQNGWIRKHTEKLEKHNEMLGVLERKDESFERYQQNCHANKLAKRLTTRRFWIISTIVTIITYITLATIWHSVGFGELILKLVNLI